MRLAAEADLPKTELLDINCVSSVVNNESAIKNLVMDDNHLKMVKVLTDRFDDGQQRGQSSSWSADFIGSKGEGQIFLLHGPPGVGKTYTTECIAEYTRELDNLLFDRHPKLIAFKVALYSP